MIATTDKINKETLLAHLSVMSLRVGGRRVVLLLRDVNNGSPSISVKAVLFHFGRTALSKYGISEETMASSFSNQVDNSAYRLTTLVMVRWVDDCNILYAYFIEHSSASIDQLMYIYGAMTNR